MDATLPQILMGFGQMLLLGLAAFGLAALLISHLRYETIARRSAEQEIRGSGEGQGVRLQLAEHARRRKQSSQLVLVLAEPADAGPDGIRRLETELRAALRADDALMRDGDCRLAAILRAPPWKARGILARIDARLADDGASARFGASSYPADGESVAKVYDAAAAALAAAGSGERRGLSRGALEAKQPEDAVDHGSLVDPLTGVLREERLGSGMHKYVAQARKDDKPASVLCVDIDNLAKYNAQYGESAGDDLLRGVSACLQGILREDDLIGRCEGDQFVITLVADAGQAMMVGRRLVAEIRKTPFSAAGLALRVTVSVGAAGYPDLPGNARHLFEAAELAARRAHDRGGNACVMFEPEAPAQSRKSRAEQADVI